jgi:cytochrome c peroxidase
MPQPGTQPRNGPGVACSSMECSPAWHNWRYVLAQESHKRMAQRDLDMVRRRMGLLVVLLLLTGGVGLALGQTGAKRRAPEALAPLWLPLGLVARFAAVPAANPFTAAKIALGKQLFWDPRWSTTGTVACVSCHQPEHGWSDPQRFSVDHAGKPTTRHTPTLINRLFSQTQGWAGHRASLEELLATLPFTSPAAVVRLGNIPDYQEQFHRVFGSAVTPEGVAQALAAYTRTVLSGQAPYDRFQAGDQQALSEAAQRGLHLFEGKARCTRCHSGFNFTDEDYHNLGIGMDHATPDRGRANVTQDDADTGSFKTPTLRDVARSGPYMHDGSLATLEQVVDFYVQGGHANPWLSPKSLPLDLTAAERADLVTFLHALTGEVAPAVSRPPPLPH